jgi:hypothetical protein
MLHLLPVPAPEQTSETYAEAVSRLASVRHALRLVSPFAGPASDAEDDLDVAAAWNTAGKARQRWFDNRSAQLVGATAAGVEALLDERQRGREPHAEASRELVDHLRRELRAVAGIVLA